MWQYRGKKKSQRVQLLGLVVKIPMWRLGLRVHSDSRFSRKVEMINGWKQPFPLFHCSPSDGRVSGKLQANSHEEKETWWTFSSNDYGFYLVIAMLTSSDFLLKALVVLLICGHISAFMPSDQSSFVSGVWYSLFLRLHYSLQCIYENTTKS